MKCWASPTFAGEVWFWIQVFLIEILKTPNSATFSQKVITANKYIIFSKDWVQWKEQSNSFKQEVFASLKIFNCKNALLLGIMLAKSINCAGFSFTLEGCWALFCVDQEPSVLLPHLKPSLSQCFRIWILTGQEDNAVIVPGLCQWGCPVVLGAPRYGRFLIRKEQSTCVCIDSAQMAQEKKKGKGWEIKVLNEKYVR